MLRELAPRTYFALQRLRGVRHSPRAYDAVGHYAQPEPSLYNLSLPAYVDTIVDVGCGAGRNLVPFDGKYKLVGIDIEPYSKIKWLRPFRNFTYIQASVEELCKGWDVDLSRCLVFTHGTMMYLSKETQERFFALCKQNGCKNFVFQEYDQHPAFPNNLFKLPAHQFKVETNIAPDDPDVKRFSQLDI